MISGEARGLRAGLMRLTLGAVSPVYSLVMRGRNLKFDRGIGVRRLPRPVVSVGNITTGGTGKTPVVRWLCERLRGLGERPGVLMRGYKSGPGERGDEQLMLEGLLNREGVAPIVIHAEADRCAGGATVLRDDPSVSVLVMDDGFQHRRLGRDFDLVLVDGCEPLGFGRVLPRGLLREPTCGLKRADAILITRANEAVDVERAVQTVRRFNSRAPIFRCSHIHVGLRSANGAKLALEDLAAKRFFAFAGIGNPEGFAAQLKRTAGEWVGGEWFEDHRRYTREDLKQVMGKAQNAAAQVVVTTEKDWVKIAPLLDSQVEIPIWRLEMALKFEGDDEAKLLESIKPVLKSRQP